MTDREVLVVMGLLGLSRDVAATWTPNDRDIDVTINTTIPEPIGRAEVVGDRVFVRAAPSAGGKTLAHWKPGPGYELWAVRRSANDAREWCLLTGHGLEGWCASQFIRRL